jgi:hypothetical protein
MGSGAVDSAALQEASLRFSRVVREHRRRHRQAAPQTRRGWVADRLTQPRQNLVTFSLAVQAHCARTEVRDRRKRVPGIEMLPLWIEHGV